MNPIDRAREIITLCEQLGIVPLRLVAAAYSYLLVEVADLDRLLREYPQEPGVRRVYDGTYEIGIVVLGLDVFAEVRHKRESAPPTLADLGIGGER